MMASSASVGKPLPHSPPREGGSPSGVGGPVTQRRLLAGRSCDLPARAAETGRTKAQKRPLSLRRGGLGPLRHRRAAKPASLSRRAKSNRSQSALSTG